MGSPDGWAWWSSEADDGTARLAFEATDEHLNPAGTVHGGVLATLVDTAMGTAVRTATGDERRARRPAS